MSESRNALTGIETVPAPWSRNCIQSESRNALTGIETQNYVEVMRGDDWGSESRNALTGIETNFIQATLSDGNGLNQEMP